MNDGLWQSVLTSSSITIFCDVTPYSLLEIYRRFGEMLGVNVNERLIGYTIHSTTRHLHTHRSERS